jgi:hypothetical protein
MVWIGSIWLRIGTGWGLMWTRWWTCGFHKMLGSSRVAAQLAGSQEGLSSKSEWVRLEKTQWVKAVTVIKKLKQRRIGLFRAPQSCGNCDRCLPACFCFNLHHLVVEFTCIASESNRAIKRELCGRVQKFRARNTLATHATWNLTRNDTLTRHVLLWVILIL